MSPLAAQHRNWQNYYSAAQHGREEVIPPQLQDHPAIKAALEDSKPSTVAKQDFSGYRKPFLETLTELARKDPRVIFIIGDVGWRFVENYKQEFPNQFLNAGAAEQNMMNLAVGMAREGWKPYVYTMVNFIVFRPYEQVRNNIAHGNANVKLFAVMGSSAYAFLGMSHNIYDVPNYAYTDNEIKVPSGVQEDQRLMDHLPNMKTYYPQNDFQVKQFMEFEHQRTGPAYFRI